MKAISMTGKTLSMTGFGRATAADGGVELTVEVKSVNHRFLDVVCRLPGAAARYESEVVRVVRTALRRGRVEVFVARADARPPKYQVSFNEALFGQFVGKLQEGLRASGVKERNLLGPAVANILTRREVLEIAAEESSVEGEWPILERALAAALTELSEMRRIEGAELEAEMRRQLGELECLIAGISQKVAETPTQYRERLTQRLERISPTLEVDPDRLAQEVALLADRVDTSEELARLASHVQQFQRMLTEGEGGRKLEFLLQEFGREINTIGSKAQNGEVTLLVVDAKAVIEKLREQVQNVE
ncbi:MAG: YicC family protein [Bdellovibrionales bacterium]|nr:YicC family protein [Bdellovibrionales bacterium]